jgi:hypothetical protein
LSLAVAPGITADAIAGGFQAAFFVLSLEDAESAYQHLKTRATKLSIASNTPDAERSATWKRP